MGDFQAVDLDAVLDQFEFHEEEKLKLKNVEPAAVTTTTTSCPLTTTTATFSQETLGSKDVSFDGMQTSSDEESKELRQNQNLKDILSDLKTADAAPADATASSDAFGGPDEIVNAIIDVCDDITESTAEESSPNIVRFDASHHLVEVPDPMSDSLVDHLDRWSDQESLSGNQMTESQTKEGDSPASDSESNPSFGQSIYDKYPPKSSDQEESEQDTNEHQRPDPMDSLLAFKPEEMSDEELNRLLEQLKETEIEPKTEAESPESETEKPLGREMGARPKQPPCEHPPEEISADNENQESAESPPEETGNDCQQQLLKEPINVVLTAPSESPPPYSEIDPAKQDCKPGPTRPTSLEIETGREEIEEEEGGAAGASVVGPPGSTPANPSGPNNVQIPDLLQGLSEDQLILGKVNPFWVPDAEAPVCMICDTKFTLVKRRHHCRACGKVLCASCCSDRFCLPYLEDREARVCRPCKGILERLSKAESMSASSSQPTVAPTGPGNRPNPSNPMEYCSTVSPMLQASQGEAAPLPPVMVPVSALKRFDTTPSGEAKQVMFSDGIRPGGDLTELDEDRPSRRSGSHRHSGSKRRSGRGPAGATDVARSMIPPDRLPYVSGRGPVDDLELKKMFGEGSSPVPFTLNRNLRVYVSSILYSPISNRVWNFRTQGLTSVGQDEIVVLLVQLPDEALPPRDIFEHLQTLYELAGTGTQVSDMGHSVILSAKPFLGGTQYGGFLYFRHTFQCIDGLDLPPAPYLFAILLTKWEMPWARVFPLRLLLRLGAEARYYPAPLWSTRQRQTVFKEIGNTIMKLLSDFRNFTYSLPIIRNMVIHMEDKLTTIIIPKNSYSQIQKALQNSNDPVLALGANFSLTADSHLVAAQREEDEPPRNPMNTSDYETQAINILNKPRRVTGASFIVLNGALKSSSGLTAKSSIVEDGIMVQVSPDRMMQIRKSLNNMEDCRIDCGHVGSDKPDETVYIKWIENDQSVNAGIKSLIDGSPMDGIISVRVKGPVQDYISGDHCIRWTELFILPSNRLNQSEQSDFGDPPDPSRIATHIAKAVCVALMPHLQKLREEELSPLAVRVCLDPENAGYEAGSRRAPLPQAYMNSLDNQLVPIVHGQSGSRSAFELVFHILDV